VLFFMAVLAGEEPIDHFQKAMARAGVGRIPPVFARINQIHIAEEARHISFAHKFIVRHLEGASLARRTTLGLLLPVIMRVAAEIILGPPVGFRRKFNVPDEAMREAFWEGPRARQLMRDFFPDVRALAQEAGLMTPVTRRMWRKLGVDGDTSRYRSEPAEFRRRMI
jgi:hypothetical protein